MRVAHEFLRDDADQSFFHRLRRLAGREAQPVADAENMRVDGHGRLAERHVEHDIGGLAPHARQFRQRVALAGNLAAMVADQRLRQRDHVLRLAPPQADRANMLAELRLAERQHLLRRVGDLEQGARRLVDAGVGRLRRQHDGDEKREGIDVLEFALRFRPLHGEAPKYFM